MAACATWIALHYNSPGEYFSFTNDAQDSAPSSADHNQKMFQLMQASDYAM